MGTHHPAISLTAYCNITSSNAAACIATSWASGSCQMVTQGHDMLVIPGRLLFKQRTASVHESADAHAERAGAVWRAPGPSLRTSPHHLHHSLLTRNSSSQRAGTVRRAASRHGVQRALWQHHAHALSGGHTLLAPQSGRGGNKNWITWHARHRRDPGFAILSMAAPCSHSCTWAPPCYQEKVGHAMHARRVLLICEQCPPPMTGQPVCQCCVLAPGRHATSGCLLHSRCRVGF